MIDVGTKRHAQEHSAAYGRKRCAPLNDQLEPTRRTPDGASPTLPPPEDPTRPEERRQQSC